MNIAEVLKQSRIETAFIALHGLLGEDGAIQGLLEITKIPYTGSGLLSSAISMNKDISKKIARYYYYHRLLGFDFCVDKPYNKGT